jgi:hypothetical protein
MLDINIKKEFYDFGKHIETVAFLTVISLAMGITGLIAAIFLFIAFGCLKRINTTLNDLLLQEFRSSYIRSVISKIGGVVVLIVGGVNLALFFINPSPLPMYISLSIPIVLIVSGIVLIYLGIGAEMKAWKNLKIFFKNNFKMFPKNISDNAIRGCDKLRTGTLLISLWFLVIPAIIGFIYQIQGYFMLAKFRNLSIMESAEYPELPETSYKSQEIVVSQEKINYCPNCGAKLSELGKFCALCGSEIR